MTKVEAIEKVMIDNGGVATLEMIYANIEKYYPQAKNSVDWQAGLRGVLYREIRNDQRFKKIGLSIYAIKDYEEEKKPQEAEKVRIHSYIEGICVELGNIDNYYTFSADPSAKYRDNLSVGDVSTLHTMPNFSYPEIINEVKNIDVVWINKQGLMFPQRAFEIVDSIGTLNGAFNRSLQLRNFRTQFYIIAPEKHREKFDKTLHMEAYVSQKERFRFINYEEIVELYESKLRSSQLQSQLL